MCGGHRVQIWRSENPKEVCTSFRLNNHRVNSVQFRYPTDTVSRAGRPVSIPQTPIRVAQ
jgi:hypothetical protein